MPKVPCLDCGTPANHSRCQNCATIRAQRLSREREEHRPTRYQRGYDHTWRRLRLAILDRDNWICANCGKHLAGGDATVDHITPLDRGGERLAPENLQAMCKSCNSRKRNR